MRSTSDEVRDRLAAAIREYREQGLSEENTAERLLEIDPDYPPGLLAMGSARMAAGDLDDSETLLWRALAGAPSHPGYYFPLAALYRTRGDENTSQRCLLLGLWKLSFYEEVPAGLEAIIAKVAPPQDGARRRPEDYEAAAEELESGLSGTWTERLLPHHLLNEVQKQAGGGLDPDLVKEIVERGDECAPVFEAAVREVYSTEQSSLSEDSESLLTALLGEIGRVELIDELVSADFEPVTVYLHSQWATYRLGQRFPAEALSRLREAGRQPDLELRAIIAEHLYFLRAPADVILELLDGVVFDAPDDAAAHLLLTAASLQATIANKRAAQETLVRYGRRLSKEGVAFLREAQDDDTWAPALISEGINELDLESVCVDGALLSEDEGEHTHDDEDEFDDDFEDDEAVPPPGRNDPCWCGSGKKYKKCHLQADEERARKEEEDEPEATLADAAWGLLLEAAAHYNSRAETQRAMRMFTGTDIEFMDAEQLADSGFFDWYLFDYRSERNGRTVIEEFLRRRGERLTEESLALIESWRTSRYGLWEVVRIDSDRGAELKDVYEGDTVFVENTVNEQALGVGSFLIHRIHQNPERWQFVGNGFVVRPEGAAAIRQQATTAADFRLRSHEWRRFALEHRGDDAD
jgi:hypothetical protein